MEQVSERTFVAIRIAGHEAHGVDIDCSFKELTMNCASTVCPFCRLDEETAGYMNLLADTRVIYNVIKGKVLHDKMLTSSGHSLRGYQGRDCCRKQESLCYVHLCLINYVINRVHNEM